MLSKVYSAALIGLDAEVIEVEVDIARGERKLSIVGLADKAVQEARERLASALRNSELSLGPGKKIINLAPADIPKTGPSFDLAMAIGILNAQKKLENFDNRETMFLGELALDGKLRPVKGVLPIADSARHKGFKRFFVPRENVSEAVLVEGVQIYPVATLKELLLHYNGFLIKPVEKTEFIGSKKHYSFDLKDVKGQLKAKRALEIAAAGGHNLLFSGVPGSGKTFLAKVMPSIMPEMTYQESIEVTRIYSISTGLDHVNPLITIRPFRSPHHTASQIALVGGGSNPLPGEVSLAHNGVLFLDELPEFDKKALEVLRQPMEDGVVTIARATSRVTYPAGFQLVAAMNPCKCGFWGDDTRECTCSERERLRYSAKVSGPVMDRIDLRVHVSKVKFDKLSCHSPSESSQKVKERVQNARNFQLERSKSLFHQELINSRLAQSDIFEVVSINSSSKALLKKAVDQFNLSARGYFRILKIARTIADLSLKEKVETVDIAEALSFRIDETK